MLRDIREMSTRLQDAEESCLIEAESLQSVKANRRISNNEYRMSKECILPILYERLSAAKPPFEILRFDIRYSAVRCSTPYFIHLTNQRLNT